MAEASPKEKSKNVRELWKRYHVEGDKVSLKNKTCPKCDKAVLLAEHKETKNGKFSGIVNHFHVSRNKWDAANLDWDEMLSDLRD